jgi:membrane dipeptidase
VLGLALLLLGCMSSPIEPLPATIVRGADAGTARSLTAPGSNTPQSTESEALALARRLSQELIIVDGHVDLPYRLKASSERGRLTEDVSRRTEAGHFDFPRARAGGLDAPFMSIYVPHQRRSGNGRALADELIDMVEQLAQNHPDKFALARSPADVRRHAAAQLISLPIGIENGAALDGRLSNVRYFQKRGVSYITLTHSRDNALGDSSYEQRHTHGGLSAFGKRVLDEMNRVGLMIDVSHASDATFQEAVERSRVPVIASHSSLRHFVPGFERNLSDAMLEQLARKGGVVMINFGSEFLRPLPNQLTRQRWQAAALFAKRHGLSRDNVADRRRIDAHLAGTLPMVHASVEDIADHIDRARQLVGIDHVGLGSDFEGTGDSLPTGLRDASQYPNLLRVLIARGYTRAELEQLCSGNILRVWQSVLDYASSAALEAERANGARE